MIIKKICSRCKKNKSLDYFYNNKKSKDKKTSICKKCISTRVSYLYKNDMEFRNKKNNNSIKYKKTRMKNDIEFRKKQIHLQNLCIKKRNQRYNNMSDNEQLELLQKRVKEILQEL